MTKTILLEEAADLLSGLEKQIKILTPAQFETHKRYFDDTFEKVRNSGYEVQVHHIDDNPMIKYDVVFVNYNNSNSVYHCYR